MARLRNILSGVVAGGLLVVACGGDGDGGTGGGGGGGPTGSERTAMATALDAAAVSAEAAGDGLGVIMLKSAAGMIGGGLTVTSVSGVTFSLGDAAPVRLQSANAAGSGWAFGIQMTMLQSQNVGGIYEGAVVISGADIAFGMGLVSSIGGFVGSSFGEIWSGPSAGWAATALQGTGQVDSIIGGNCLGSVPVGLGVTECTPVSVAGPGFNITASAPMNFPGNTATGSNIMAFGPPRLRGADLIVDCQQSTYC